MTKTNEAGVLRLRVAIDLLDEARHLVWLAGEALAEVTALAPHGLELHATALELVRREDALRRVEPKGLALEHAPDDGEECAWRQLESAPSDVRRATGDVTDFVLSRWQQRTTAAKGGGTGPARA